MHEAALLKGMIFDLQGRMVRSQLPEEGQNVLVWDGKDDSGVTVHAGVYIYQVEANGKIINGTVVVAK